ncbi:efflux RND transporter periplasmic adaptor subunit [Vibrio proteolyticus]|uniref:Uncharacterized protein n=1 Tax=Vibrio proteolyticus NBRC 13287 TaxID=1219065 RepID=U2ZIZ1_VIBPR|nr:efflux RND transporter periplasmic adaptor subunit [Vibrio proteolyticus]GAD67731.1 hypothetical protein VPR01S_09_01060 [Vibrio proteolyticus NBRC 13287]
MPGINNGGYWSQKPWLVSAALVFFLCLWLGLGSLWAQDDVDTSEQVQTIPLAKVVYQTFHATPTHKIINLYGRTAPDRQATLGAEIAGKIVSLALRKGSRVEQGQVIAHIDPADLDIQFSRALAMLKVREKEFNAARALKNRGLQGEVAFATAEAQLAEAKAMASNARLALRNTQVRAPFAGIIDQLLIETGDFVAVGDPVATLIDLDKVVIEADVSERHIQYLQPGQAAQIRFIDGENLTGRLRYVSRVSSPATNTFPIEIEIDNPEQRIPAGVSAEVAISLNDQLAVKVTPAMLALDEAGNLGVKTLQDNVVHFVPIQLVKAEQDGVWLAGLGEVVDIITVGQGFVRDGDQVIATPQPRSDQS